MPGLDDYFRYIDKQDKGRKNGAESKNGTEPTSKNGNGRNGKGGKKSRLPQGPLPGSVEPGVRYVLKNGVTVAVPNLPDEMVTTLVVEPEPELLDEEEIFDDVDDEGDDDSDDFPEAPDYIPPLVEAAAPTEVAEAPARPRPPRRLEPDDTISDGDAAALWKRLPRHIQLLVGMTPETKEEPAQKYYSRGFKESRQQLIERLLDPTMTLEDTARVLGVCPTTVRRYTNRGVLPHYRTLGQQRRFRLSDVLAFLEKQQKQAAKRRKALFGDAAG